MYNQDEWVEAEKFYISPEHDNSDGTDICSEGCDWCLSEIEDNGCEGHETLRGDMMGESFFCDGKCISA